MFDKVFPTGGKIMNNSIDTAMKYISQGMLHLEQEEPMAAKQWFLKAKEELLRNPIEEAEGYLSRVDLMIHACDDILLGDTGGGFADIDNLNPDEHLHFIISMLNSFTSDDDPEEIREAYEYAFHSTLMHAEAGHAPSQFVTGIHFLEGIGTVPNAKKGLDWINKAAAQGYEDAREFLETKGGSNF